MLYRNNTIQVIKYSVSNEINIERIKQFEELRDNPPEIIEDHMEKEHLTLTCRQKACLPFWCWKSFIHDKHEAFRFKYDTKALLIVEDELMDRLEKWLYVNSFIYYIIMFICPLLFMMECGGGIYIASHIIYGVFALYSVLFEVITVLKI